MANKIGTDVALIGALGAVPTILEAVAALTGLRFVCVARVTPESWTTCAVLDKLDFGLKPGDELAVRTTLCHEVQETRKAVIIDCVSDDQAYCNHHTPRMYGFQSYISIPVYRADGEYFGTLCGLDPLPRKLSNTATVASMTLFAQLISLQLASEESMAETRAALLDARETALLREQFIAVLGHDLRNPLGSIKMGVEILRRQNVDPAAVPVIERMGRSVGRMSVLVDDVVDFTRGRMGGGLQLQKRMEKNLHLVFAQVISELQANFPERQIAAMIAPGIELMCDAGRMGQLLSNLLTNALVHGDPAQPVRVHAASRADAFELVVSNAGPDIPPDIVGQLFKPFWRASRDPGNGGLGLGLFIVSEIAKSHGGTVSVVSEGGATTFIYRVSHAGAQA